MGKMSHMAIFKWSMAGLKSKFFVVFIDCCNKAKCRSKWGSSVERI